MSRARGEHGSPAQVVGMRGLGSFCHGRDGTNLIVPRPSMPYNAIAVDTAERSLNYGRLCGEVAIKVIRLGSASVESLPDAVSLARGGGLCIIDIFREYSALTIYRSFGDTSFLLNCT